MAVTSKNILRQGSKGSDVTELQRKLNSTGYGYNLAEDGDFGSKTLAAVKDYQQRSGLPVDGIVGTNTWGALDNVQSSTPSASASAENTSAENKAPTFEYKPSDTVTQAQAMLQQQMAQKPGAYQSTWKDQLNGTIAQILNRDKFSYDLNGDALYQQYADQYTTQGKLASMDVMGQAAAMTGGYGNSYAQQVGQQAYQGYLQQLNDVVPELYGMALDQYNQEGQQLYDQAAIMAQMEDQEYGRYQDQLSQYYTDLNYLTENARYMSETEYQKALDEFNIKYSAHWDQKNFDEGVRQYNEQFAYQKEQDALSASRPSVAPDGTSYNAPAGWDTEKIKEFQRANGLTADGIWGPKTQAAYDAQNGGVTITDYTGINNFHNSIHSESEHDAVMRHMYGSYRQYVAEQIEKSSLSDKEKEYLISYYGIQESDTNYKPH